MKKKLLFLILQTLSLNLFYSTAQVNPGTTNLTHQWTFDNGAALDKIGNANGTLIGSATINKKALNTTAGGYLTFPASAIAINTYEAVTTEIWFTSLAGQNSGNTMLSYFGDKNVNGWMGANYLFSSPSNTGNCRVAISTGNTTEPWLSESGVNSSTGTIDDGALHQMVTVLDNASISVYIDGLLKGSNPIASSNSIAAISNAFAYLCKGGYSADPTWKGMVHKYSIYNKALNADEALFLFQDGAESSSYITTSVSSLSFDEIFKNNNLSATAYGFSSPITIGAPEGITVSPQTLAADATNATVDITYDGATEVNGDITFSSGSTLLTIPVKASPNDMCFIPLYKNSNNLISDPYLNSLPDSWGNVSLINGTDVYCGSHCIKISGVGSCWPDGGSIASGQITWIPYTTYRFHAKVKTMDGTFNMGVQNANVNGVSGDYDILVPFTNGEWIDFDATFTTGANPTSGVAYFNNCGLASGLTAYIDNWELYAVSGISTSEDHLYFDEISTSSSFKTTGVSLTDPITISAPDGFTVTPTTLSSNAVNQTINVIYDGTTSVAGNITLTSSSYSKTLDIDILNNSECYQPLYPDRTNLIADPYLNNINNFSKQGNALINKNPDYSYCGVSSGMISGYGSIIYDLTGTINPNSTYRLKAKVFRRNPGNVTYTLAMDAGTNPVEYDLIKTAMDSACYYFNRYTPFEENIYVYYNEGIPTAQASYHGSIGFGPNQRYMWVGTAIHEMDHYFGSGTSNEWLNLMVNGVWTGNSANSIMQSLTGGNIYGDNQHFWPYGINQKEEITNMGDLLVQDQALTDAVKVAKAMLVDDCGLTSDYSPVGIGVYGWDGESEDLYYPIEETNTWQDIDITFTTGTTLGATQGIYFGNGSGYIDNWELYDLTPTSIVHEDQFYVVNINAVNHTIYLQLDLSKTSNFQVKVYDVKGRLALSKNFKSIAASPLYQIHVPDLKGIYIVKIIADNNCFSSKVML